MIDAMNQEWLRQAKGDPEIYRRTNEYHQILLAKQAEQSYVDMIMQLWAPPSWYDAGMFSLVHSAIIRGQICVSRVRIGEGPYSDKMRDENNEILARLEYPYEAQMEGGPKDQDDGYFACRESTLMTPKDPETWTGPLVLEPRVVPLEVGYTRPQTTIFHIMQCNGVARWPYRSENIWVLNRIDPTLFVWSYWLKDRQK